MVVLLTLGRHVLATPDAVATKKEVALAVKILTLMFKNMYRILVLVILDVPAIPKGLSDDRSFLCYKKM